MVVKKQTHTTSTTTTKTSVVTNLRVVPRVGGNEDERTEFENFADLARRLVQVPKHEIDEERCEG